MDLKIVALAGGVGGAKLVGGLARLIDPDHLTIIVNTADDFTHLDLDISPDLDTVLYTLAGLADPERGWGRVGESWAFLDTLGELGGPTWFRIGDRDLALHHLRTARRKQGDRLSEVTHDLRAMMGVKPTILPMSDDLVQTIVLTDDGQIPFQEYFVARACEPVVTGFKLSGIEKAKPAPGVLNSLESADVVIFCPSNPWVSLDPILAVAGVSAAISHKPAYMISPIIGGKAVKGPAAKMYSELGIEANALAVARHYADLLSGIMIDTQDAHLVQEIEALGLSVRTDQILMKTLDDRERLAGSLLRFIQSKLEKEPG